MKRTIKIFGVLLLALCLITGCLNSKESSSNDDKKAEEKLNIAKYDWYEVEIPDGFVDKGDGIEFDSSKDSATKIKMYKKTSSSVTAESYYKDHIGKYDLEDAGSKKIGNYTWYMLKKPWNSDSVTVSYYGQINDKTYVEISTFKIEIEDKLIEDFIKSFKYIES